MGHTAIRGFSAQFRALASTLNDDARDNTATTFTETNKACPSTG